MVFYGDAKSYVEAFASGCLGLFVMTDEKKIVIVGCGAAGGTAAQFARKNDRKAKITIIESGKYTQYSKCGIPYAISGHIPNIDDLIEFSVEWFNKMRVECIMETSVEDVDMDAKTVKVVGPDGKKDIDFDELIIATGSVPFVPPIKGVADENKNLVDGAFVVRTLDDARGIKERVKKGEPAVVVGAGLVGLETGEALVECGMDVTVVEATPSILPGNLDVDMAKMMQDHIEANGMKVFVDSFVTSAKLNQGSVSGVEVKHNDSGEMEELPCSLLIVATGTRQITALAGSVGCKLGKTGGILVNEKSETNVKHVYAAGDCSEYIDFITGNPIAVGLGSIAVRQAIAAGVNAAGGDYSIPKGLLLTRTSEFFGLQFGAVGPTSEMCEGRKAIWGKYNGPSLPEYMPGGEPITMKLGADLESSELVGAQGIGRCIAQRVNVFATAILGGMTIDDFRLLETAYAPIVAPTLDALTLVSDVVAMKMSRRKNR